MRSLLVQTDDSNFVGNYEFEIRGFTMKDSTITASNTFKIKVTVGAPDTSKNTAPKFG